MKTILVLAIYFFLASSLFYISFCRLSMTSDLTRLRVRTWLWGLSAMGACSMAATVVYGYLPSGWHVALLVVLVAWQYQTKDQWKHGTPDEFQKRTKDDYPCQLMP